jgi:hypothetical protein
MIRRLPFRRLAGARLFSLLVLLLTLAAELDGIFAKITAPL